MTLNPMLRLACRVCLELGIDDPELWLHTRPKRVVNTWAAYWRVEPWGMPWHRHAQWMLGLDHLLEVLLAWASGGKAKYRARRYRDWMPPDWYGGPRQGRQSMKVLKKQLGVMRRVFANRGCTVEIEDDDDQHQ